MKTIELSTEDWQHLLSLAERGAATVVQQLSQQPGQMSQVAEVAGIASRLIQSVGEQLQESVTAG
jgi:hypothetical protein